jgi:signal transduction histidine kinase
VRIVREQAAVEVEVTDDGHGRRERAAAQAHDGHGITGMRERAAAVGGSLDAGPLAGGGFRVHASLPTGAGLE